MMHLDVFPWWDQCWYNPMRFLVLLAVILAFCCTISPVFGEEIIPLNRSEGNGSFVLVSYDDTATTVPTAVPEALPAATSTPLPEPTEIIRIAQGDTVYVNGTYDISGTTGWDGPDGEYRIAWYGSWLGDINPGLLDPEYILELPGKRKGWTAASRDQPSQYWYYFDPAIFSDKTGCWFNFMSNTTNQMFGYEESGNTRAFCVQKKQINVFNATDQTLTKVWANGTHNVTYVYGSPLAVLPERHVSDYVAARGQDIIWPAGDYRLWLFGPGDNGIYGEATSIIPGKKTQSLAPGKYLAVVQTYGNNTIYEASYDESTESIIPALYGKTPVSVRGLQSSQVYEKLKTMLQDADDGLFEYDLDIEEPYITIERSDEVYHSGVEMYDVRGYTNVANGTKITVELDKDQTYYKLIQLRTVTTTAVRTSDGNMSQYRAYLPIDYKNLAADARNHTLTASTSAGGKIQKNFKIGILPPDSFKPNTTLKFTESDIPFIPTPTPIVITLPSPTPEKVVVVQTVTIPVTPPQDQVNQAILYTVGTMVAAGIAILGFLSLVTYLAWAWIRRNG